MYKVVVNVSGKRARLVPETHRLLTAERDFGKVTQDEALANREHLTDAIRDLLASKGIEDGKLYSIELPDALAPNQNNRPLPEGHTDMTHPQETSASKGAITKPRTETPDTLPPEEEPETKRATDAARQEAGEGEPDQSENKDA